MYLNPTSPPVNNQEPTSYIDACPRPSRPFALLSPPSSPSPPRHKPSYYSLRVSKLATTTGHLSPSLSQLSSRSTDPEQHLVKSCPGSCAVATSRNLKGALWSLCNDLYLRLSASTPLVCLAPTLDLLHVPPCPGLCLSVALVLAFIHPSYPCADRFLSPQQPYHPPSPQIRRRLLHLSMSMCNHPDSVDTAPQAQLRFHLLTRRKRYLYDAVTTPHVAVMPNCTNQPCPPESLSSHSPTCQASLLRDTVPAICL